MLRTVVGCSAAALVLLGLAPAQAELRRTIFVERTGSPQNPLSSFDAGFVSRPAFGDLDADGDLDLVAGESGGGFSYFRNNASLGGTPTFSQQNGSADPLAGRNVVDGGFAAPALADLDGDGDLDLVAGRMAGSFAYFTNTGTARIPAFVQDPITGTANPLDGLGVGSDSTPAFADLDADGDLDLVSGGMDGGFSHFENTGSATNPTFVTANLPPGLIDVGDYSAPSLGDTDRDGDFDLIAGRGDGSFAYFENTGTVTEASFVQRTGSANPLDGVVIDSPPPPASFPDAASPVLVDLDSDGDLDLVAGEYDGVFNYFENVAFDFVPRTGTANPFDSLGVGVRSTPTHADLDADGDLDLLSGEFYGTFHYFENTGTAASPSFVTANPLPGLVDVGSESAPAFGDLDGDGDFDLVSGKTDGMFSYFENTGTTTPPAFVHRVFTANPLNGKTAGSHSKPALVDLDGDLDLDLVSGNHTGTFAYFENTGTAMLPKFIERAGTANPLNGVDLGYRSAPTLGDLDGDGDLDLASGFYFGPASMHYFENTGTPTVAAFVQRLSTNNPFNLTFDSARLTPALADLDADGDLDLVSGGDNGAFQYFEKEFFLSLRQLRYSEATGAANPLADLGTTLNSAPAGGDLDGDGDPDLVSGRDDGTLRYFENTGSAASPAFDELVGTANPLNGFDAGSFSTPAIGDLDADGDLDVVAGRDDGQFSYFQNTGSATAPAFIERIGPDNPIVCDSPACIAGSFSAPALGDFDADGDLDLFSSSQSGNFYFFRNDGFATNPLFNEDSPPLAPGIVTSYSGPALGDLDGDADLDLLSGEALGHFALYENTAPGSQFFARGLADHPLSPFDAGDSSRPVFVDLDGDSDLDVVAGTTSGDFRVYYHLPEPGRGLLLAAGGSLLALLDRLRSRARRRARAVAIADP